MSPRLVVGLDQIRRAIEADLAHYDPTAPAAQASAYQPGMLAPALSLLEPAVRVAGADRLEVDSYVRSEIWTWSDDRGRHAGRSRIFSPSR